MHMCKNVPQLQCARREYPQTPEFPRPNRTIDAEEEVSDEMTITLRSDSCDQGRDSCTSHSPPDIP
jgi:hypothetical protein